MSIREASASDLDAVVELGMQSLIDGPYAEIIKKNPQHAREFAHKVMDQGKVLLSEDNGKVTGIIGFIVTDHHFSGQRYAAELMWYVLKDHRAGGNGLQLLWAAEKQAKEMGAETMVFTAPNDEVASIYKRFGYSKLEVAFHRKLN